MKVQVKDIVLKELPDEALITLEKSPIPADAKKLSSPGAAKKAKK
jgi:hypothetical protein